MELPCQECGGTCCKTMYGVVLDDGSAMWFENGRCPNLTADNRCGIYEARPRACREFVCNEDAEFLDENPGVVAVLTINHVPFVQPMSYAARMALNATKNPEFDGPGQPQTPIPETDH